MSEPTLPAASPATEQPANPAKPATMSPEPQPSYVPASQAAEKVGSFGKTEEKPPAPAEPPKPDPKAQRLSLGVASLARKERQLQEMRRTIEQRENKLKDMETSLSAKQSELERRIEAMESAKKDPLKWLEYGGHTYDALASQMLNDGKVTPELLVQQARADFESKLAAEKKELEAKLLAERSERENLAKQQEERAAADNERVIREFHQEVLDFGRTNPGRFLLTNLFQQQDQVPLLIEQYYRQTLEADVEAAKREGRQPLGRVLTKEEAWELVENHYRGLYDQANKAISQPVTAPGAPVVPAAPQAGQAASTVAPAAPNAAPEQTPSGERPTLTNNLATQPSLPAENDLSDDARMKRAMAAMDRVLAQRGTGRP